MSIEHNVSTGAAKPAQSAAGHGAARKSAGASDAGGFAALLLSLGADELPLDTALVGNTSEDLGALPDTEVDPAALAAADAALLASQVPGLPAPPTAKSAEAIIVNPSPASAGAGAVAGLAAGRADASSQLTQAETVQGAAADPSLSTAGKEPLSTEVQPLLRQAGLAQRLAQQRGSQAADAQQAAQAKRGEDIAARLGWQISETPSATGQAAPALLAAGLGEAGLRPYTDRNADKYGTRGGVGEVGAFAGVARAEGARLDVPAVAPDGGLTTEMRVAEQVSYYVGRGAQSAELEIEGVDERPLHVSIDLQGQEARIEFRAEQAQTRQVLQDAMPHLREMLAREGLTLAGMSVGHSGPQGGQEQAGQGRSGGRQARVVAEVEGPAAATGTARPALPPGRSVDLFV